ncbi:hypothetical protein SP15_240 [Bacillus phage SP-15]|uniref:Uncharacterized protein n=1 Tax=Bacillus phage SP-15 TaxID=1792032 RepID=A0A127AWM4_9CAUD|nr:hypothetical protein SP15_240 [Bacillus phage SP-15]AMM45045.1 hypothetical protein SP15_240 [Bacillus phage SP-15]
MATIMIPEEHEEVTYRDVERVVRAIMDEEKKLSYQFPVYALTNWNYLTTKYPELYRVITRFTYPNPENYKKYLQLVSSWVDELQWTWSAEDRNGQTN